MRLAPKHKNLLIIGVLVVAIVAVLLVTLFNTPAVGVASGADSLSNAGQTDEDNDILATALSSGEYSGTVLTETADAGVKYVEDTLFIGDSNTAGLLGSSSVTNISMKNGIGIVSMGISHVTSLKCVKFSGMSAVTVPEAVKILQPRRIVINFGTNDYYMSVEKYIETYATALDAIKSAYPYADIIIASVLPITSNCSYYTVNMPTVEKFNLALVQLAKEKNLKFLNWSEVLKNPATGYCNSEYMAGDGVHLSKKGMEAIIGYFRTHSLDTEDRRPKPLTAIPNREATPAGLLGVGMSNSGPARNTEEVEKIEEIEEIVEEEIIPLPEETVTVPPVDQNPTTETPKEGGDSGGSSDGSSGATDGGENGGAQDGDSGDGRYQDAEGNWYDKHGNLINP